MATKSWIRFQGVVFCRNTPSSSQVQNKCRIFLRSGHSLLLQRSLCSSATPTTESVSINYNNGIPQILVPLPSRQERCQFTLKPLGNTVGDFIQYLQDEDGGIDRAAIYSEDGLRVAKCTDIATLLQSNFRLELNDRTYSVTSPPIGPIDHDDLVQLYDVKSLLSKLHSTLNVEEHQLQRERDLISKLEDLKVEIEPLEKSKLNLELYSKKRVNRLAWMGLGMMGIQFGLFARLTWWEYSWDIMEPVTYFATYATSMAMFAYYCVTKEPYEFPIVRDREFLKSFHKSARTKLDINKYNQLKTAIYQTEYDLKRLRDPLQVHLPIKELEPKKSPEDFKPLV
ncbi:unnamed protein product [Owenia fusiformis]|uniref:Calcium uniporter protein n=1 Tax=Owenia fusiformis TaxID=6347 RepID=A0A8J1Y6X0_OWEFU|nr:unnamed protein product [Owenia fusiformis]